MVERLLNAQTREETFNLLVLRESGRIYNMVRKMVLNHDDADDIVQNTFMKAWMALDTFRGDSKLTTWLHRIAINECLSFLSKQHPADSLDDAASEVALQLEGDPYFDGDETELQLQQAIASLPDKQRVVFNLKYFEEMKYEDMSNLLGTSVGALKTSYHLAVKKIQDFFNALD